MKKTLILWRHAQAEIGNDDFNRSIDDRGIKESKIMSEFLLSNSSPDLILSSPARRAQETLKSFIRDISPPPQCPSPCPQETDRIRIYS